MKTLLFTGKSLILIRLHVVRILSTLLMNKVRENKTSEVLLFD